MVKAYVLIQSEPGKAVQVVGDVLQVGGVTSAEGVTGPYEVVARQSSARRIPSTEA